MDILITGAASRLGQAVAEVLEGHRLRLMDETSVEAPADGDAFEGSLLDQDAVWRAVRGMDAVIHTASRRRICPNPS